MLTRTLGVGGAAVVFCSVVIAAVTVTVAVYDHPSPAATTPSAGSSQPSPEARQDIPADTLAIYQQAATVCPGLDWTILAGIGKIETNHGRSTLPGVGSGENSAGAGGPMQFLAPTFDSVTTRHPTPPGGAVPPSRYDPTDAIYAAAYYLCDNGAATPTGLRAAIFQYNHADWYVEEVLNQAARYAQVPEPGSGDCQNIRAASPAALTAITFACRELGQPYVWGGNGPTVNGGWDCSGLTKAAYAAAGITLPRTAQDQYYAGPPIPENQLQPGDLVYYGTSNDIHHVGLYLGAGKMINAPTFNRPVQIGDYRHQGDDYFGATRPLLPAAAAVVGPQL